MASGARPRSEWRLRLAELYRELDVRLAALGASCAGCGECCRFDRADHVLYASLLERLYLAASEATRAEPGADAALLAAGLRCPFQSGGRCLAREGRVLGCRLHHCAGDQEALGELSEAWHARLRALHDELGFAWDYRPLLPWAPPNAKEVGKKDFPA